MRRRGRDGRRVRTTPLTVIINETLQRLRGPLPEDRPEVAVVLEEALHRLRPGSGARDLGGPGEDVLHRRKQLVLGAPQLGLVTEDVNEIVEENHALFRAHRIRARGTRILEDEILPFRVAAPKLRRGLGGRRNLPHERKGLGVVLAAGIEEAAVFPDSVCLALTRNFLEVRKRCDDGRVLE